MIYEWSAFHSPEQMHENLHDKYGAHGWSWSSSELALELALV